MSVGIALADFMQLLYGNNSSLNDGVRGRIREMLGKDLVESMSDMRAVTMALDQQAFPTPMLVRFSEDDVKFSPVNGIDCPFDRHDISASVPGAFSGSYEPHLVACFSQICLPGSVAFDIGANVGYHTLLLSKLAGTAGHVYAFEPNSENCRLILLASEHNHVLNITLLPVALSDQRGWAYFSSHIGSNGGFVSRQFVALHGHGTVVPTFTLDEMAMPKVDVIKVDVEGAEYKVLKGGELLLSRSRPAIVCEFSMEMVNRVSGVVPADFLNWISGKDYKLFVLDRGSNRACAVDSISALCDGWGSLARIEDLLFLPREKTSLLGGA
jgi:FkbM family methyltransferase